MSGGALIFLWAGMIALWLIAIPPIASHLIPAWPWFEVRRVWFEDSVSGIPPRLTIDRTIRRPFRGSWDATVKIERGAEFIATDCKRYSPSTFDYRPDAVVPSGADLRWWLSIPPNADCSWLPGRYLVETTWSIYLIAGVTLRVEAMSNVFTIHETGWTHGL